MNNALQHSGMGVAILAPAMASTVRLITDAVLFQVPLFDPWKRKSHLLLHGVESENDALVLIRSAPAYCIRIVVQAQGLK